MSNDRSFSLYRGFHIAQRGEVSFTPQVGRGRKASTTRVKAGDARRVA